MNRNSSGSFTLSKANTGFLNYKTAEGLAQRTLYSSERILVKWVEYMGDCKVTSLRSGGDVFTLQEMLGHGSLDMVRHCAQVAQVDVEQAHRKASPVDN